MARMRYHAWNENPRNGVENPMPKRQFPRGIPVERADQITFVAVAVGIMIVTGFLVGLLF